MTQITTMQMNMAMMCGMMMDMSFSCAGSGTVPGLDAEKRRPVRVHGPKCNRLKVRIGNLDATAAFPMDERDPA